MNNFNRLDSIFFVVLFFCRLVLAGEELKDDARQNAADKYIALREKMSGTARGLFFSGCYKEALAKLEQPANSEESALKAEVLVEIGRDVEAIKFLNGALHKNSDDPSLLAARAAAYMVGGEYAKADADLKLATRDIDTEATLGGMRAKYLQARLYYMMARRDDWYDHAGWLFDYFDPAEMESYSPELLYLIGSASPYRGDYKGGLMVIAKAAKKDETFLPAFVRMADIYNEKYQYVDARREVSVSLQLNPSSPEAHLVAAKIAAANMNLSLVENHALKVLAVNPRSVEALLLRAHVAFMEEHAGDAVAFAEAALKINPSYPDAIMARAAIAAVYDDRVVFARMERKLLDVVQSLPFEDVEMKELARKTALSRFNLCVSQAMSARRSEVEAIKYSRKAYELDKENYKATAAYAVSLMRHGLDGQAEPILREAFANDRFNIYLHNLLRMVIRGKDYRDSNSVRFHIKIHKDENPVLSAYVKQMFDRQISDCEKVFGYRVEDRVRYSIMRTHSGFSARVTGLPRLDASGATFGPFVALVSPLAFKEKNLYHNWESTSKHEIAHVVTLSATDYRIPRWLTEGMSVYVQGHIDYGWDIPFKSMVVHGFFPDLRDWNKDFTRPKYVWLVPASYHAAGKFVEWMVEEYGADSLPKILGLYRDRKSTEEVFKAVCGKDAKAMNAWFKSRLIKYAASIQSPVMENPARLSEFKSNYEKNQNDFTSALGLLRIYFLFNRNAAFELAGKLSTKAETEANKGMAGGNRAYVLALEMMAGKCASENDLAKTEKFSRLALEFDSDSAMASFYLALALNGSGKTREAVESLRLAINRYPRFVSDIGGNNPYRMLSGLLSSSGDVGGAIEVLEEYWRHRRNDVDAVRTLAEFYGKLEKFKESAGAYRRLFGIYPYVKADHVACAAMFDKAGMKAEAGIEREVAKFCKE